MMPAQGSTTTWIHYEMRVAVIISDLYGYCCEILGGNPIQSLYCCVIQPVGVQCPLTSSLGEFPGYRGGIRQPFPASVVIFIMLMLLHTKEVLINKKLG